jgi:hypothetical protein
MKPLTLSFLVLCSIVLFAVLATCEDCHKQFDEEIKNSSSVRVLSWVKEIVGHSFDDTLSTLTDADSVGGQYDEENIDVMKRMIIGPFEQLDKEDSLNVTPKSDSVSMRVGESNH